MFKTELVSSSTARPAVGRDLLVCFSHLRWDFVFQRPQHLLTRAAKEFQVVYFEEPIFEPNILPRLQRRMTPAGVEVATPVLPEGLAPDACCAAQKEMLESLLTPTARQARVFWYYTPMALSFSAHVPPDVCVYDCMDELSLFKGAPQELLGYEALLLKRADLVFTGGESLYRAKRALHPAVTAFPSSVDRAHFASARDADVPDPADQRALPRPRAGFFGVIDERMDLELLERAAALRPDWAFVMLGPVVKIDPASLPRLPNIHWLGGKRYDDLPKYLAHWDLAIMPFAKNDATRFISPTKTPEFLAAGKRVVSTSIADVVDPYGSEGLVEIADGAKAFVAAADRVIGRANQLWLARVDRKLSDMSWDRTWALMRAKLRAVFASDLLQEKAVL